MIFHHTTKLAKIIIWCQNVHDIYIIYVYIYISFIYIYITKQAAFPTRQNLSETSRQIHLPRKQCLINRKRHRHTTKAYTAIDSLSIIWKSDLTDKMKCSFFQAAGRIDTATLTTWTLTKRLKKKRDGKLHKNVAKKYWTSPWRQHPTKHQLYDHLPLITKTIQVRRTRHAGHCWRSRDEFISEYSYGPPTYGQAKAGWPDRNIHTAALWGYGM